MSEGNGYVSLDALTKPKPLPEVDVNVAELGGKVRLRGMTVSQKSRWEKTVEGKRQVEIRQRLLAATIIKPEGITEEHIAALGDQDASVMEPLVDAALQLIGIKGEDLENLSKNSEETTGGGGT